MAEQTEKPKEAKKEERKEEPKHEKKDKLRQEASIVRIAGKDIAGSKNIENALLGIKGIGHGLANALSLAIYKVHGISRDTEIGSLSEEQIGSIEELIKDPLKAKIPSFLLNRRKDFDTGIDMHLVGTDLIVRTRQDIENDIKAQNYRGFRHRYGQKVRGQRTRSTGRTGATVGVTKKTVEAEAKAAKKGAGPTPGAGTAAPVAAGKEAAAAPAAAAGKEAAPKPAAESAK